MSTSMNNELVDIRDVWTKNLEDEIKLIREIVDEYPYIGMDTEFPGKPMTSNSDPRNHQPEETYQEMTNNVNQCKLVQLGLCFCDEQGNLPTCGTDKGIAWQFNFNEFNPDEDLHTKDSIVFLEKHGLDFEKMQEKGIEFNNFGEQIMSSGALMNDKIKWVTFEGLFDMGYFVKLLKPNQLLPENSMEFKEIMKVYFPVSYDLKNLIKLTHHNPTNQQIIHGNNEQKLDGGHGSNEQKVGGALHGSLEKVGKALGVKRSGAAHQAGSDSLLTVQTFLKLIKGYPYVGESLGTCNGVINRL